MCHLPAVPGDIDQYSSVCTNDAPSAERNASINTKNSISYFGNAKGGGVLGSTLGVQNVSFNILVR